MTFQTIQERLLAGNLHGDEIAQYRNFIAVWLARYYEEYGNCVSFGARWTTESRNEYKSQAECERAYQATEQGIREVQLKQKIKGMEAIQEVLTSQWFQLNKEAKSGGL